MKPIEMWNAETNDTCYTCKRPKPFASICPECSRKSYIRDHYVSLEDYKHATTTPTEAKDED